MPFSQRVQIHLDETVYRTQVQDGNPFIIRLRLYRASCCYRNDNEYMQWYELYCVCVRERDLTIVLVSLPQSFSSAVHQDEGEEGPGDARHGRQVKDHRAEDPPAFACRHLQVLPLRERERQTE